MKKHIITGLCLAAGLAVFPRSASADLLTFTGTGVNTGLSATADFTLLNATTLRIVLTNTSTSLPSYLSSDAASNQLLTSLAFRLPGTTTILGGTATISGGSTGPAGNIGKEWGYGWNGSGQCCENTDPTHTYNDWISTLSAGTTQFSPGSLDNSGLNGPKYGLAPNPAFGSPLTSISNSATFTLNLSGGIPDLSFLSQRRRRRIRVGRRVPDPHPWYARPAWRARAEQPAAPRPGRSRLGPAPPQHPRRLNAYVFTVLSTPASVHLAGVFFSPGG